jgi:hypothetical protein
MVEKKDTQKPAAVELDDDDLDEIAGAGSTDQRPSFTGPPERIFGGDPGDKK